MTLGLTPHADVSMPARAIPLPALEHARTRTASAPGPRAASSIAPPHAITRPAAPITAIAPHAAPSLPRVPVVREPPRPTGVSVPDRGTTLRPAPVVRGHSTTRADPLPAHIPLHRGSPVPAGDPMGGGGGGGHHGGHHGGGHHHGGGGHWRGAARGSTYGWRTVPPSSADRGRLAAASSSSFSLSLGLDRSCRARRGRAGTRRQGSLSGAFCLCFVAEPLHQFDRAPRPGSRRNLNPCGRELCRGIFFLRACRRSSSCCIR